VFVDIQDDTQGFIRCFQAKDVDLPSGYHFGLSASSSNFADDHDVIYMETYQENAPVVHESEV
jgi:hypothetical protein